MSTQANSTQQIANRLVELCRQGKITETQEELFSDDVESIEPVGAPGSPQHVKGKAAVIEKSKQFDSMVEEFHSSVISDPVVAGNTFAISWVIEVTMKGRGRSKMEEICVYTVKDGKIASEQFFFTM